jgi:hypothetical protein
MRDDGSAISRALDMFQAMLRTRPTVNPTADREVIAAARRELSNLRSQQPTQASGTDPKAPLPGDYTST